MTHIEPTVESAPRQPRAVPGGAASGLFVYVALGALFGVVLTKSEAISWFRIFEMFRFQSFHMYGILFTAALTAMLSLQIIKRLRVCTLDGEPVVVPPKVMGSGTRYWLGGTIFGLGWGLIGACPGPMFVLIGHGVGVAIVALLAALVGTWLHGAISPRLPE